MFVPTAAKIQLIRKLMDAGLKRIEAGSFVSPKWVPQMADTSAIFEYLSTSPDFVNSPATFSALTPNSYGMNKAFDLGVKEVAIFGAASETFSRKNINCSVEDSMRRFEVVLAHAKEHGIPVRGYISCVLACPYEGPISPDRVAALSARLMDMGCFEISLGDTIGVGTPASTRRLLDRVLQVVPANKISVHFHDTYGMAIANILVALEKGISVVDSSVSGLGGCPYAKGASGNVATEDVVYLLDGLGIEHGVNMEKLSKAQQFIDGILGRKSGSKVAIANGCSTSTASATDATNSTPDDETVVDVCEGGPTNASAKERDVRIA